MSDKYRMNGVGYEAYPVTTKPTALCWHGTISLADMEHAAIEYRTDIRYNYHIGAMDGAVLTLRAWMLGTESKQESHTKMKRSYPKLTLRNLLVGWLYAAEQWMWKRLGRPRRYFDRWAKKIAQGNDEVKYGKDNCEYYDEQLYLTQTTIHACPHLSPNGRDKQTHLLWLSRTPQELMELQNAQAIRVAEYVSGFLNRDPSSISGSEWAVMEGLVHKYLSATDRQMDGCR